MEENKVKEPINISYNKLWKLLIDKGYTKTQLRELAKLSPATMSKIAKEENITTEVISKICKALQCDVKDIMEYKGLIGERPEEQNKIIGGNGEG